MRKKLLILGVVVTIFIVGCSIAIFKMGNDYDRKLKELTIDNVDLSRIADGNYNGSYKLFPVEVEVQVTIKDHSITKINIIKHQNGKGQPAEAIIKDVIDKQSIEVDTISGATGSSKTILKAIEIALNKGVK